MRLEIWVRVNQHESFCEIEVLVFIWNCKFKSSKAALIIVKKNAIML